MTTESIVALERLLYSATEGFPFRNKDKMHGFRRSEPIPCDYLFFPNLSFHQPWSKAYENLAIAIKMWWCQTSGALHISAYGTL